MVRREVLVLGATLLACRPATYGRPLDVQVPLAEADVPASKAWRPEHDERRVQVPVVDDEGRSPGAELRRRGGPRPSDTVQVPPGSSPRTLRPGRGVTVQVPRDEALPREMAARALPAYAKRPPGARHESRPLVRPRP